MARCSIRTRTDLPMMTEIVRRSGTGSEGAKRRRSGRRSGNASEIVSGSVNAKGMLRKNESEKGIASVIENVANGNGKENVSAKSKPSACTSKMLHENRSAIVGIAERILSAMSLRRLIATVISDLERLIVDLALPSRDLPRQLELLRLSAATVTANGTETDSSS